MPHATQRNFIIEKNLSTELIILVFETSLVKTPFHNKKEHDYHFLGMYIETIILQLQSALHDCSREFSKHFVNLRPVNLEGYRDVNHEPYLEHFKKVVLCKMKKADKHEFVRKNYSIIKKLITSCTTAFEQENNLKEFAKHGESAISCDLDGYLKLGIIDASITEVVIHILSKISKVMTSLGTVPDDKPEEKKAAKEALVRLNEVINCSSPIIKMCMDALKHLDYDENNTTSFFSETNIFDMLEHFDKVNKEYRRERPWLEVLGVESKKILERAGGFSSDASGWVIDSNLPDSYLLSFMDRSDIHTAYNSYGFPRVKTGVELVRAFCFPTQQAAVSLFIDSYLSDKKDYQPLSEQLKLR